MKKLTTFFLCSGLLFSAVYAQADDIPPARLAIIKQMMSLDGSEAMAQQMRDSIISAQRQQAPLVRDDFWKIVERELAPESLLMDMIQAYNDTFTDQELQAAIRFYSTPEGKSIAGKSGKLSDAMFQASQRWAEKGMMRAQQRAAQTFLP